MRGSRLAGYAVAGALLLTLGACGSPDPASDPTAPDAGADATASTAPAWNPCGAVDPASVGAALGADVTRETGTADNPRCAFLPKLNGGPTLNVTYLWFDGGFERAWRSMGTLDGTVTDVHVPGADAARIVVRASRQAVLVTGFVKTGRLIETVNAIGLAPYDRAAVVGATRDVLAVLSRHAPASEDAAG